METDQEQHEFKDQSKTKIKKGRIPDKKKTFLKNVGLLLEGREEVLNAFTNNK